jgi:hypothetical protein
VPDLLVLIVFALAAARITGLIVSDSITEPARDRLIGWLDDRPATLGSFIAALIQCPWCAGMWVSFVAAPVAWFWGDSPLTAIPALALAISQVIGMIASIGRG